MRFCEDEEREFRQRGDASIIQWEEGWTFGLKNFFVFTVA